MVPAWCDRVLITQESYSPLRKSGVVKIPVAYQTTVFSLPVRRFPSRKDRGRGVWLIHIKYRVLSIAVGRQESRELRFVEGVWSAGGRHADAVCFDPEDDAGING